jgi:hypothetical protein
MADLHFARRARRTRRNRNAFQIERNEHGLGRHPWFGEARRVGQALRTFPKEDNLPGPIAQARFQLVAQPACMAPVLSQMMQRRCRRRAEPRDGGRILGAGATPFLLASPAQKRVRKMSHLAGQNKGASPQGSTKLMT